MGQGRAPLSQDAINWYMQHGIPGGDDIKRAPVPSVVDLCATLLQLHGTMSFERIIAPALALLDAGKAPWHPDLAVTLRRMVESERSACGGREEKIQAACDRFYGRPGAPRILLTNWRRSISAREDSCARRAWPLIEPWLRTR